MAEITYLKGDATQPQAKGNKIIAHICNDLGGWGKGFVLAISKRWPEPEAEYRQWHRHRAKNNFNLGEIQLVNVEQYIWVANMIGQRGIKTGSKGPPRSIPRHRTMPDLHRGKGRRARSNGAHAPHRLWFSRW